ncbi:MAG: HAD-IC family P-type ATPase [Streptosporangiaceae bacterium]
MAGRLVEIGRPAHLLGAAASHPAGGAVAGLEETGQTAAVVRVDGTAVTGAAPILLTGDNVRAARRLAAQVGIRDVRAGLLPQDKDAAVTRLQAEGHRVLLAGDGINDAPALAAAHTGVAMGRAGSDLALDTADAVIMRDDLATIPAIIALSRRARRVITANLVIAAAIIAALVAWDLAGHLPLPLGVAGHEGSTVIVGLNGLRLLRGSAWRKALLGLRPLGALRPLEEHPGPAHRRRVQRPRGPAHLPGPVFGFLDGHVLDEMRELVEKPDETDLLRLGLHRLPIGDFPCSAAWRPSWPPMTAPPSSNAASASG